MEKWSTGRMGLKEFLIYENLIFRFCPHHSMIPLFHNSSLGCRKPPRRKVYEILKIALFSRHLVI
jgi:hypothetical protein